MQLQIEKQYEGQIIDLFGQVLYSLIDVLKHVEKQW